MQKFHIRITDDDGKTKLEEADGEPFIYDEIHLFLHRVEDERRISEQTTGLMLCKSTIDEEDAINTAKRIIDEDPKMIHKTVSEAIKRLGLEKRPITNTCDA